MRCVLRHQARFFFILATFLFLAQGYAQSPSDDFARRQAEEQKKLQLETLRQLTPNAEKPPSAEKTSFPQGGVCFVIDRVNVEGAVKISRRTLDKITLAYAGKCIDVADIQQLLKSLTNSYLKKGYVAARVYIPEQDIKTSRLIQLVVEEGKLGDIYYNGRPASPYDGVIMSALPRMKSEVFNMRDVEQGIDQINRLASNNAKSDILPGKKQGETILNITNQPQKRWQANISHDNLGQASTGYARYNAGLTLDNVFQVNDLWNLNYQQTNKDYWHGSKLDGHSHSYSASVSIPNGYWTFNMNGYYYKYGSTIQGNFSTLKTSGNSSELKGTIGRLLHRDGKSLTTLNMGLAYKETNNFLLGNKIDVGSRVYTVANLDIAHSRQMLGGTWAFDLNYSKGLDWFGAVKKKAPGAGDAEPQFSKISGTISLSTPFKLKEQNFILSHLLVGQYAADNLLSAEQISMGSSSNVRGTRDSLIFGNNGFFSRNDLAWRTVPWSNRAEWVKALGELRPYIGLDYGQIFAQKNWGFDNNNLSGWTVGAKLVGGRFSFDIGYSNVLSTTVKAQKAGMAFITTSLTF